MAAALIAAATKPNRYITGYALVEALFIVSQYIYSYRRGPVALREASSLSPKVVLWKDILLALDSEGSKGVDQWLSTVFGASVERVKRDNIEKLLSGMSSSSW